jgi:hypothetical protein
MYYQKHNIDKRQNIRHQLGAGLYENVMNKLKVDTAGLRKGEIHAPLYVNGKFRAGNYAGPGTNLVERLKDESQPISDVDKISKAHDIRYSLAKTPEDINRADKQMLKSLYKSNDSLINRVPAGIAIGAKYGINKMFGKMIYPKVHQLNTEAWSKAEDRPLLEKTLEPMIKEGYGVKRRKNNKKNKKIKYNIVL